MMPPESVWAEMSPGAVCETLMLPESASPSKPPAMPTAVIEPLSAWARTAPETSVTRMLPLSVCAETACRRG